VTPQINQLTLSQVVSGDEQPRITVNPLTAKTSQITAQSRCDVAVIEGTEGGVIKR